MKHSECLWLKVQTRVHLPTFNCFLLRRWETEGAREGRMWGHSWELYWSPHVSKKSKLSSLTPRKNQNIYSSVELTNAKPCLSLLHSAPCWLDSDFKLAYRRYPVCCDPWFSLWEYALYSFAFIFLQRSLSWESRQCSMKVLYFSWN